MGLPPRGPTTTPDYRLISLLSQFLVPTCMSSSVPPLWALCLSTVSFPCTTFCGLTPHTCARHRVWSVSVLFIPIRVPLSIAHCALCLIGLRHSCDSAAAEPATATRSQSHITASSYTSMPYPSSHHGVESSTYLLPANLNLSLTLILILKPYLPLGTSPSHLTLRTYPIPYLLLTSTSGTCARVKNLSSVE
ncbi:hypothetical protein J6590_086104 [Homalodisca vitripennis]|nr:hypothetical protein J6590_105550 [Homalodisca vitripennis]KAG8319707.1 hypothetical protein J6590_086104 [Homalodisca vitripennis]